MPFLVAEAPIAADGTFTVKVPDFYHDPLSSEDKGRGLDFRVSSTTSSPQVGFVSYGIALDAIGDFGD